MKIKIIRILSFLFNKSGLWKSRILLLIAAKFNNAVHRPNVLTVNGKKLFIHKIDDPLSSSIYYYGQYEPFETRLFQKLIKKGDIVVDVGAHIGYYTLISSTLVGKTGKVFSFEPDPSNLVLLKQCVAANKITNVVVVNNAVSNVNKKINFYLSNENKGDNRMFTQNPKEKYIQVAGIILDDYFAKSNFHINFIKMDIQGAEVKALQGMPKILRNNRDVILAIEFWPYGYMHSGSNAKELLDLLNLNKFLLYNIGRNEETERLIPVSSDLLLRNYHANNYKEMTNILCIRNESRITSFL